MYDMITIGDIKLDTFVVLNDASVQCELKMPECKLCVEYGKKIPVNVVDSQMAGSAPNVAVGLSRMKFKTAVLSGMGEDATRTMSLEVLKKEGVGTQYIKVVRGEQSSFSVVLNYKGEKTILESHVPHIYSLPKNIGKSKWMYVSELGEGYERLFSQVARHVKKNKIVLGFNPGAVQIKERKKELYTLIKETHILFTNVQEAQRIAKKRTSEIHQLADALKKLGPKLVVITDGRAGAYVQNAEKLWYAPMFPGERIEATGAGDAFATGFMGALMNGQTYDEGLRWGSVNAASVVQFVGPQKGLLTAGQIRHRLSRMKEYKAEKM